MLEFEEGCIEEKEEHDVSTQFVQTQENQPNNLPDQIDRYGNVLPVFGYNGAKHDNILIKSVLAASPC